MCIPNSIFGVILIMLVSCTSTPEKNTPRIDLKPNFLKFTHDTLASVHLPNSFVALNFNYQVQDSLNIIYFYHKATNYLSKVDLNSKKIIYNVPFANLSELGADKLNNSTSFVVYRDTILFFDSEYIHFFLRSKGYLRSKKINDNNQPYYFLISQSTFKPIIENNNDQTILLPAIPNIPFGSKNKLYYSKSVEVKLNLGNNSVDTIPVSYPKSFLLNYYGASFNVDRYLKKHTFYYGFQSSDTITIYDSKLNTIKNIYFGSHQKHDWKNFDWDKVNDYTSQDFSDLFVINPYYTDFGFDSKLKLFYRIYYEPISLKNEKNEFNSFYDKRQFILFYDEKLNYYGEAEMQFLGIHFDTKEGTIIPYMKENKLYFLKLDVTK